MEPHLYNSWLLYHSDVFIFFPILQDLVHQSAFKIDAHQAKWGA